MTSVTKCFPGKAITGGGDRVPSKAEQALCQPYLDQEIELVNPAVILPVGRLAIDILIPGKKPLHEVIGEQFEWNQRSIIPLPHPSGASRWHQIEEHQRLIDKTIVLIEKARVRFDL